jgi:hypothetical protein
MSVVRSRKEPIYILGGLGLALPIVLNELVLLNIGEPWWLPHPAGTPAPAAGAIALAACLALTALLTHAFALLLPEGLDWQRYKQLYNTPAMLIIVGFPFQAVYAGDWLALRQVEVVGTLLAALATHAAALVIRRGRHVG